MSFLRFFQLMADHPPFATSSSSSSFPSNYLPLTPMTTMDDQDSPLRTSDQLEQIFGHRVHDPLPFFDPSALNLTGPAAGSLVPDSVSSIDGETDSSSGVSNHDLSQQELPSVMLNSIFWNPNVPQDFEPPFPMYQDWPLPTPDQLAQLLLHQEVLDPFPFFDPSAPNVPLVSSIYGETDSSSSGVYFRDLSVDETPTGLLYSTFRNPHFWNRPPETGYKLNVAVTFSAHRGSPFLGAAAILRDNLGVVHRAYTKVWRQGVTPLNLRIHEAERNIFIRALEFCIIGAYHTVIAETESLSLVRQAGELYQEDDFEYFEIRLVTINDNRLAHRFASVAYLNDDRFWTQRQITSVFGRVRLPF
ncbi:hypothetical protein L6164_028825 [Bauhinia variegata]|uniref:Uncharacterized protein n=1 Tax=Bauhinia variegata TaxID=167791 RepID=A0ACB9L7C1_BAUVA|nr:hypothetical protein L6164_028825 [Bauhinia variegata]